MLRFILKRILFLIPTILGVTIIVFTLSYFMPGDPVAQQLGSNYTMEDYEAKKAEMGLDQPYMIQLGSYVWGVVTRFDLGTSYDTNVSIIEAVGSRIWVSIRLGLMSCILMAIIAIPFGVVSATKQYSILDGSVTLFSILFASAPSFFLALMAMLLFSLKLKWLPASGLTSWKHYILPVLCSALMSVASTCRITRSSMLEVVRQDYICTARSKGLKEGVVIRRHALKNALIPVITVIGAQASHIIGGSVVIETIFSIPGMGSLLVTAINSRDYPMILGLTFLNSMFLCIVNLIVDVVYSIVDPRIRAQFSGGAKKKAKTTQKESATGVTA